MTDYKLRELLILLLLIGILSLVIASNYILWNMVPS